MLRAQRHRAVPLTATIAAVVLGAIGVLSAVIATYGPGGAIGLAPASVILLLAVGPALGRRVAARPLSEHATRVLVFGVTEAATAIVGLASPRSSSLKILGFVDDAPDAQARIPTGYGLLGKPADVLTIARRLSPHTIVVAPSEMRGRAPMDGLLECRVRGIEVVDWPSFYERHAAKVPLTELRPSWLTFSRGFVRGRMTGALKRALDLIGASVGLVLTGPLMALIALAIKLDSPGPVFFSQKRVGLHELPFTVLKFRSMQRDAELLSGPAWAARHDPRVTRVGQLLRRTRLDELPQLINVLRGDMSLVGPRPERPEFIPLLAAQLPFYSLRHSVKPGLTGWAQVRQGYAASVDDARAKLECDLYYAKNLSLGLDLVILLRTIPVIVTGRGAQ
jgi:sugar transferase (PEP-CTERM system associated)